MKNGVKYENLIDKYNRGGCFACAIRKVRSIIEGVTECEDTDYDSDMQVLCPKCLNESIEWLNAEATAESNEK